MSEIGKVSEICGKWTISDFFSYIIVESCYFSPNFYIGDSKWKIGIYPNGDSQENKEYVSLFLFKIDDGTTIAVEHTFGIKTSNNTIDFELTTSKTLCKSIINWGWSRFIPRSELVKRKSELVPSGDLTIAYFVKMKNSTPDFQLGHKKLSKDLKDLWVSKDVSDVTLTVKKHSFEAHRSILAARSPVFAAMFRNDTLEKKTGIVKITDADPDAFNVFLAFLYSGEVEFYKGNIFELYKISHKYDVPDLRLICVSFLIRNLSVDNFCETLLFSHKFEENELSSEIQSFFSKNFEKVVSSHSWLSFLKKNTCLGNNLLKSIAPKVKIMDME